VIRLTRREWLGLGAAGLLLFASAAPWINVLGLEYDECHFVEAATRIAAKHPEATLWPEGAYLGGRPFPFMTMPYVGALDGWLMAIPVSIFGYSPLVPRLANTFVGWLLLIVAYLFARHFGGWKAGAAAVTLLLADLEFLLHVPTHYGPFFLQCACGALVWYWLDRWLTGGAPKHFCAACFFAGLAFQEKLTFVWTLFLIAVLFLAFRRREVSRVLTPRTFVAGLAIFLAAMLPVLIYTIGRPEVVFGYGRSTGHAVTWDVVLERLRMFWATLAGQEMMLQQLGAAGVKRISMLPWLAIGALVIAAWFRLREAAMMLLFTAGLIALQAPFAEGGRLHHYLLAYPLLQTGIALAFTSRRGLVPVLAAGVAITGASTAHNLRWYSEQVARTGGAGHWSSAIYDVADWIDSQPPRSYFSTTWGFSRPLSFLTRGRVPVHDRYYALRNPEINADNEEDLRIQLARRDTFWLTSRIHPEYAEIQQRLFAQAQRLNLTPKLVREFRQPDGQPIYWVYRFHPPDERPWRAVSGEAAGALEAEFALPQGASDVRFRLPARRWSRALTLSVEFYDRDGKRLRSWWRAVKFYQFPWPDQRFAFGPGLHPDYFVPLPGEADGDPARLVVRAESERNRPVDLRIIDVEVRYRSDSNGTFSMR
jgi:4-amino-4-deoxy-L-arabinose transferase-like glycosyltransferase